jgi:hypothetical protein
MKRQSSSIALTCLAVCCISCKGFFHPSQPRGIGWTAKNGRIILRSSPEEEAPKLILGDDLNKQMEGEGGFKWTQSTYVEMAQNRADEYNKKKEQGLLEDETTAESTIDLDEAAQRNFGPDDLSQFTGFPDEGWEASLKNNEMANLIAEPGATEGEDVEESSLFVPGEGGDDLILL